MARISTRRKAVRVKHAKKSSRSIRYLLSADTHLRRLSLKKLSARLRDVKLPRRSSRAKTSRRAKKGIALPWVWKARAIALAAIGVIAAAVLLAARQPVQHADLAMSDRWVVDAPVHFGAVDAIAPPLLTDAILPKAPTSKGEAKAHVETSSATAKTAALEVGAKEPLKEPAAKAPAAEAAKAPAADAAVEAVVKAPPLEATTPSDAHRSSAVAVTGCLEADGNRFWLKDTTGDAVPQSRSWKSGFLKKHSASIAVVDGSNSLKLADHVGQRVTANGVLVDREIRAQSLHRVRIACD
jgi:hypothetical protein